MSANSRAHISALSAVFWASGGPSTELGISLGEVCHDVCVQLQCQLAAGERWFCRPWTAHREVTCAHALYQLIASKWFAHQMISFWPTQRSQSMMHPINTQHPQPIHRLLTHSVWGVTTSEKGLKPKCIGTVARIIFSLEFCISLFVLLYAKRTTVTNTWAHDFDMKHFYESRACT